MSEVTNKKTLKGTRRVSDVERICQINHERRKLAEENEIAAAPAELRNDKRSESSEKRTVLHTAFTACMMAAGGCATFVCIGITMGHWSTVVIGSVMAMVFLLTGARLEGRIDHG